MDFLEVQRKAQQENKGIWMILKEGEVCRPCDYIIREMDQQHVISNFDTAYLFYECDISKPENRYLGYIFLLESSPHFFLLGKEGEVEAFQFQNLSAEGIGRTMGQLLKNEYTCAEKNLNFQVHGEKLLELQNDLLKANLLLQQYPEDTIRLKEALNWVEKSMSIEPYFYNLYCASRINRILGEDHKADTCAMLALKYSYEEYPAIVYRDLIAELKLKIDTLKQLKQSKISFDVSDWKNQQVALGDSIVLYFEFKNLADEPLRIISVSSSCSCAHPEWDKQPVKKGGKGKIKIVYYAKSKGFFARTFSVYSNASTPVIPLYISGYVR